MDNLLNTILQMLEGSEITLEIFFVTLVIVLPPVSNETINLVKDTSLIYILAMNDLLRVARTIVQREFDMTPFLIAGVFYLAMTFVLTWMFKKLEAYYGKYDK